MKNNVINDLAFYDDLKIVQNKDYFMMSLDSILLPDFVDINSNNKKIIDLCSGNLPIPLVLTKKTKSTIYAVELQKEIYNLGIDSLKINNIGDQINLLNEDVKNLKNIFLEESFDIVTCNPPYFKDSEFSNKNSNIIKTIARHETAIKLEDIIMISKYLLKNGGDLYLVHRTDRLIEIIELMKKYNFEPKKIRLVYPKKDKQSNICLVCGKKNGNTGLKILPPLIIHDDDGKYSNEVLKIFGNKEVKIDESI